MFGLVIVGHVVPTIYATQAHMHTIFGPSIKTVQRSLYHFRDSFGWVQLQNRSYTSNITHLHPLLRSTIFAQLLHDLFIYSDKPKGFIRQIQGYLEAHQEHFKNVLRYQANAFEEYLRGQKTSNEPAGSGQFSPESDLHETCLPEFSKKQVSGNATRTSYNEDYDNQYEDRCPADDDLMWKMRAKEHRVYQARIVQGLPNCPKYKEFLKELAANEAEQSITMKGLMNVNPRDERVPIKA